jgi:hypothetical protein
MTERKAAYNKVLPKAGLKGFYWAFVQGLTSVLLFNFCASISPPSAIPEPLAAIIRQIVDKN